MISENITVKQGESWLHQYKTVLANASLFEKRVERREFYTDPCQLYPDYLDYKEEWEWASQDMLSDLKQSFIYRMSVNRLAMQCDCGHTHILIQYGDVEGESTRIVNHPTQIPSNYCWYQTIEREITQMQKQLHAGAAEFPNSISKNLYFIMQWSLSKTGRTPTLLPFEVYKEIWWNHDITGGSTEMAKVLLKLLAPETKPVCQTKTVNKPEFERYFFTSNEVVQDHGFHNFYRSLFGLQGAVIKIMNRLRRSVGLYGEGIKEKHIQASIGRCPQCKKYPMDKMSIFGIYAALPGSGKTTAQTKGLFIGFDTDWIGIGPTWEDYSYLLRHHIPIITNQPKLFIGSGVKIQLMLSPHIRKDRLGRPMGSFTETKMWAKASKSEVNLILLQNKRRYVTDAILLAQMCAHLQVININMFLNAETMWTNPEEMEWHNNYGARLREVAKGVSKVRSLQNSYREGGHAE